MTYQLITLYCNTFVKNLLKFKFFKGLLVIHDSYEELILFQYLLKL